MHSLKPSGNSISKLNQQKPFNIGIGTQIGQLRPIHMPYFRPSPLMMSSSIIQDAPSHNPSPKFKLVRKSFNFNGFETSYLDTETSGPTIILIHGFGASSDYWRALYPTLSQKYRVIGIDLLGYGQSAKPNIPMSIQ